MILWLYGRISSGKTTLSYELKKHLQNCIVIDEDDIRKYINQHLGKQDPATFKEHHRILAGLAKWLSFQADNIIVTSLLHTKECKQEVLKAAPNTKFICINTPLYICELRDIKELYRITKQWKGTLWGYNTEYNIPYDNDYSIATHNKSIEECVEEILTYINK